MNIRYIYTGIFVVVSSWLLIGEIDAQSMTDHNPSVLGGSIELFNDGKNGVMKFTFLETNSTYEFGPSTIPLKMNICLLNAHLSDVDSFYGEGAELFDWQYDQISNCVQGVQKHNLVVGQNAEILMAFELDQNEDLTSEVELSYNVNIVPPPTMVGVNMEEDDQLYVSQLYDLHQYESANEHILKAYPNPLIDDLSIDLGRIAREVTMDVYDAVGNRLISDNFQDKRIIKADYSALIDGIYTIRLNIDNETKLLQIVKIVD